AADSDYSDYGPDYRVPPSGPSQLQLKFQAMAPPQQQPGLPPGNDTVGNSIGQSMGPTTYTPNAPTGDLHRAIMARLAQIGAPSPQKAAQTQAVIQNTQPATMLNALPREDLPGPMSRVAMATMMPLSEAAAIGPRLAMRSYGAVQGLVGNNDNRDAANR